MGQQMRPNRGLELIEEAGGANHDYLRPAAGTAAGGATVAGRRHRDGARPATGSHNPQAVRFSYTNLYRKFGSTSPSSSILHHYLKFKDINEYMFKMIKINQRAPLASSLCSNPRFGITIWPVILKQSDKTRTPYYGAPTEHWIQCSITSIFHGSHSRRLPHHPGMALPPTSSTSDGDVPSSTATADPAPPTTVRTPSSPSPAVRLFLPQNPFPSIRRRATHHQRLQLHDRFASSIHLPTAAIAGDSISSRSRPANDAPSTHLTTGQQPDIRPPHLLRPLTDPPDRAFDPAGSHGISLPSTTPTFQLTAGTWAGTWAA
ncbi:hypothetical protein ACLOJK_006753 [Asimina triloba]